MIAHVAYMLSAETIDDSAHTIGALPSKPSSALPANVTHSVSLERAQLSSLETVHLSLRTAKSGRSRAKHGNATSITYGKSNFGIIRP